MYSTEGYDSKKMAYTMLSSGLFIKCECSIVNNEPKEFDRDHVFPRDMYIGDTITDKNVGTYFNFIKLLGKNRDNVLHCTCALDESDNERITFMGLGANEGVINFTTFGNRTHNTKELFEKLINKYNENTQTNF
jgi:hypothetical protein